MSEPHVYVGILREEDGHIHIHLRGEDGHIDGKFLCLNRHDLDKAHVQFAIIKQYDSGEAQ